MRIGNVIKSPEGDLWIITEINDEVVQAVSFDCENCSAVQKLDDSEYEKTCSCEYSDPHCESCGGKGFTRVKLKGWKHSKVLAPTVKAFIMNSVKRAFRI